MSPAEQHPNSDRAKADSAIETIYTTVEAQHDRTDWLTVVSNLRQINRQLVEEIARLEQALASAKQNLHNQKEANQTHEITILQQQDDLKIAHDRVGALFQQLETSHQIGQRQQTLIETLSQQLEIVQTIVPQIEAENEELQHKYQQQSQKLIKTEQVAIELHRRLKLQGTLVTRETPDSTQIDPTPTVAQTPTESVNNTSTLPYIARSEMLPPTDETNDLDPTQDSADSDRISSQTAILNSNLSTAAIEPAPPVAPIQLPDPASTPSPLAASTNWREAILQDRSTIASNKRYSPIPDLISSSTPSPSETVGKESTTIDDLTITKSSTPNWPAPTVNRDSCSDGKTDRPTAKAVKIDLPRFPKKVDG